MTTEETAGNLTLPIPDGLYTIRADENGAIAEWEFISMEYGAQ